MNLNIEDCEINNEGSLVKKNTKKDDLMQILHNYKGEGLTILSSIGSNFTGIFFVPALLPSFASMVGWAYLMKQKKKIKKKIIKILIKFDSINSLFFHLNQTLFLPYI